MKKWKKCLSAILCAAVLLPGSEALASEGDPELEKELAQVMPEKDECMFEDGDVVGFIGDSITQVEYTGISYQEFIYNYYITRHPDWKLEFRNLGTASYMAADAVRLYSDSAVVTDKAIDGINKAVIMFGMNEALHNWSAKRYIQSINQLIELLNDRGITNDQIILVAPTPYDQTRSSNYDENGKHQPGYTELISELSQDFPLGQAIIGEQNQKDFVRLFGAILRLKNILTAFDDFEGQAILSDRDFQDYQSLYIDIYQTFTKDKAADKENINDDIVFEIELIRQVEINIDYILMLVVKYHESNCNDKNILVAIDKAINSSIQLRSKKELIEDFIESVNISTKVDEDWRKFVHEQKEKDLAEIIDEERLKSEETKKFIDNSFRDGTLKTIGTDIDKIMPPVSRFGGGRAEKKEGIIEKLKKFFEKYFGLV